MGRVGVGNQSAQFIGGRHARNGEELRRGRNSPDSLKPLRRRCRRIGQIPRSQRHINQGVYYDDCAEPTGSEQRKP
ncbi:MAG: hypothetical protein ACRD2M_11110, partial [Terriglobales bacterium]